MRPSRKGIKLGRRALNKTARIREIAQRMVDEGKPPRPVEIVDALDSEGVKVTSGQVCVALRGTGLNLKTRISLPKTSLGDLNMVDALRKDISLERLLAAVDVYRMMEKQGPAPPRTNPAAPEQEEQ